MNIGEENHRRFKNHLSDSTLDVFLVAHYLHRMGHDLFVPGLKVAKNTNEIDQCQDLGDIFMYHKNNRLIIEVKSTNTSDFNDKTPHKYGTFFVCAKHAFEKFKKDKPAYYFILNKSRTHVAIINVIATFSSWKIIKTPDRRYIGYEQERYACPTKLAKIEKLTQ